MKKESVKDVLGVVLFYLILILGIILLSNQSDLNKKVQQSKLLHETHTLT